MVVCAAADYERGSAVVLTTLDSAYINVGGAFSSDRCAQEQATMSEDLS